nr:polysaccharide deacetylase family protein [Peribacillus deserti]
MVTIYNPPASKKRIPIYLTFDDGPGPYMDSILNTLKTKKAKATFFMIEPHMKKYSSQVKRSVKEGHYPALHSVSHDKHKLYGGNTSAIGLEMETARKTLLRITGVSSRLTRVPYGSKPYMTAPYRNSLAVRGFKMWDWNVDTEDWKYQKTDPNRILQNCLAGIKKMKSKKTRAVVLMHVNKGTASVLPKLIDSLHKQGYECVAYHPASHFILNFWGDKRL